MSSPESYPSKFSIPPDQLNCDVATLLARGGALRDAGIAVGAANAVMAVFAAPLTPVALATAGLGLASGAVIRGAEWLLDWKAGKETGHENGLHYLLHV